MAGGEMVGGLAVVVLGGLLNGSWALPTKFNAPPLLNASRGTWAWENIWFVYTVFHLTINAVLVCGYLGLDILEDVYGHASTGDMAMVLLFSFLWGFGGVGMGRAIETLGMAVGTSLVMGIILVMGTALPAIRERDEFATGEAVLTALGVALGLVGFIVMMVAGKARDVSSRVELEKRGSIKTAQAMEAAENPTYSGKGGSELDAEAAGEEGGGDGGGEHGSYTMGLIYSLIGGVFSSMLQFAFVFGEDLTSRTEEVHGVAEAAAAMPIWLIAFSLGGVGHLSYSSYLLTKRGSWGRFRSGAGETAHNCACVAVMASFFVAHIHLYGFGAAILGDVGAAVAWPLIMSSTVLTSQGWSMVLGEWDLASPRARHLNWASMGLLFMTVLFMGVAGLWDEL